MFKSRLKFIKSLNELCAVLCADLTVLLGVTIVVYG